MGMVRAEWFGKGSNYDWPSHARSDTVREPTATLGQWLVGKMQISCGTSLVD